MEISFEVPKTLIPKPPTFTSIYEVIVLDPQIGRFPSASPAGRLAASATKSAELQAEWVIGTLRNALGRSGRIWGPKSAELQAELVIGTPRNAPERSSRIWGPKSAELPAELAIGTLRNALGRPGRIWSPKSAGRPVCPVAPRPEIGPPNWPNCKRNWRPERSGTLRNAPGRFGALRNAPAGFGAPNLLIFRWKQALKSPKR